CQTVASDGEARRAIFRMITADGRSCSLETILRRALAPSGEARLLAIMVDLSPRHEAADVLAASEAETLGVDVAERTQLEAERDRLLLEASFLSDASRILGNSLEHLRTLEAVALRAVPLLADCMVIDVLAWDGTMKRFACAPEGSADEAHARELAH